MCTKLYLCTCPMCGTSFRFHFLSLALLSFPSLAFFLYFVLSPLSCSPLSFRLFFPLFVFQIERTAKPGKQRIVEGVQVTAGRTPTGTRDGFLKTPPRPQSASGRPLSATSRTLDSSPLHAQALMGPPFPRHHGAQGISSPPGTSGAAQGLCTIPEAWHAPGPKGFEASHEALAEPGPVPGGPNGGLWGTAGPPGAGVRPASRPASGSVPVQESKEYQGILLNGLSVLDSLADDPTIQQRMLAKVRPVSSYLLPYIKLGTNAGNL